MKQKPNNPKKIHIKAVSDVLTVDETVPFAKSLKRLEQIRKQFLSLKAHHHDKLVGHDKLEVTTTPIY